MNILVPDIAVAEKIIRSIAVRCAILEEDGHVTVIRRRHVPA
jgi:uncharacterized membrane protein YcaP (DUF421 family)